MKIMKKLIQPIIFKTFILNSIFISLSSQASTPPTQQAVITHYQNQAQHLKIADQIIWQRLLYMHTPQQPSKVSYNGFFLHPNGKQRPDLELNSNIAALFETTNTDQAFRCRFPARSEWLIKQLNITPEQLPALDCAEFTTWFNTIKPHKITMIFATDFMGNPSSMFGHTLLRLDPKDQKELNLISYAVNYAATPESKDNDFAYAWKGVTGKYPSQYSLMPYYHKVKEYGDLESRDLWEYELNLSPEQTQFLVKHIWELQKVQFPYYFISDNCSYALLGLFDLLDPKSNLQQKFDHVAIPVETIKALDDAKLIKDVVYRPALETQLLSQVKQHGTTLAKAAHHTAYLSPEQHSASIQSYSALDQAKILEMAYDDLYLSLISRRIDSAFAQPRIRSVLSQRSQIDVPKQRDTPQTPKINPIQGHHARLLSVELGQVQNKNMVEIEHRQAYHDLLDPQGGHRFGTQLVFFQSKLQLQEDRLKLENFKLMSANSLNPINPFKTPLSWGMQFSWQQESVHEGQFSEDHQHGVINLNGQAGYTIASQNNQHLCYAQMQGIAQIGKSLDDGWRVAPAPTFGCLNQWTDHINSVLQVEIPYWLDQTEWNLRLNHQWQYAFNQQNAIRATWQYQQEQSKDWQKWSVGFSHFF